MGKNLVFASVRLSAGADYYADIHTFSNPAGDYSPLIVPTRSQSRIQGNHDETIEMHSEIQVENVFSEDFEGKIKFVLQSQIVSGVVKVGMDMTLRFNSGLVMTMPIDEVEIVDNQYIKIKVHCDDSDELEFLLGLNLDSEILTVE
ncbi:MAG: hypothetical protein HY254_03505 [Burkholderiales bacterium]|nr:hypothetical protein [Burkholderiales bacterium]